MKPISFCQRLEAFFLAHPGEWIDGRRLEAVAGRYAWRSRVSDLRKRPYTHRIENRQRHIIPVECDCSEVHENVGGVSGCECECHTRRPCSYTVSEYRFVPDVAPVRRVRETREEGTYECER
jgi:hypothetical protein